MHMPGPFSLFLEAYRAFEREPLYSPTRGSSCTEAFHAFTTGLTALRGGAAAQVDPADAAVVLSYACVDYHLMTAPDLEMLLGAGLREHLDGTPLLRACASPARYCSARQRYRDVIRVLLDHGADPNLRDADGDAPLLHAPDDVKKLLLDRGADPTVVRADGLAALHRGPCHLYDGRGKLGYEEYLANEDPAVVAELLARGADPRASWRRPQAAEQLDPGPEVEGVTPLHTSRHVDVVRALLRAGAEVAAVTSTGRTALHWLVQTGPVPVVKELLKAGAPVNAQDHHGQTPLHLTDLPWLQTLLEHGADPTLPDHAGRIPLTSGLRRWLPGAERQACQGIRTALRLGTNPRGADADGTSMLHLALTLGKKGDLVRLLLEAGADPRATDALGDSPLASWAREGQGYQGAETLLAALQPADVRSTNASGQTPLHLAVLFGQPRRHVELLLTAGADPCARDGAGVTPYELARGTNLARVVRAP